MTLPPVPGAARPVVIDFETPIAPEVLRAALVDFGADRPKLWPGITPNLYKVHSVGDKQADVQEGTAMGKSGFWAREHYDWSDPQTVRWTVQESNFCKPKVSYVEATITPRSGGGARMHIEWNRQGSSFGGRIARVMIVLSRGAPIRASFVMGLKEIAKRNGLDPEKAIIR